MSRSYFGRAAIALTYGEGLSHADAAGILDTSVSAIETLLSRAKDNLRRALDLPQGGLDLEQVEKELVLQALERTNWNQTRAAKLLGLNRDQIHYRIEKFSEFPEVV